MSYSGGGVIQALTFTGTASSSSLLSLSSSLSESDDSCSTGLRVWCSGAQRQCVHRPIMNG